MKLCWIEYLTECQVLFCDVAFIAYHQLFIWIDHQTHILTQLRELGNCLNHMSIYGRELFFTACHWSMVAGPLLSLVDIYLMMHGLTDGVTTVGESQIQQTTLFSVNTHWQSAIKLLCRLKSNIFITNILRILVLKSLICFKSMSESWCNASYYVTIWWLCYLDL